MKCPCGKLTCPQNDICDHCYCEMQPDFKPGTIIGYAGPIYQVCCKCSQKRQIGGPTPTGFTRDPSWA